MERSTESFTEIWDTHYSVIGKYFTAKPIILFVIIIENFINKIESCQKILSIYQEV